MSSAANKYLKFGSVTVLILLMLGYLAYTGVQDSKSYYVAIKELRTFGDQAYGRRLREAGNVQSGTIKRAGIHEQFVLVDQHQTLSLDQNHTDPQPATFNHD